MGEDALLQLVQQFLDTPQGQNLLQQTGNVIDVESINRRIAALDKDLSREERQERRAERRNFRQQKREDRRKKRREEIQRLRAQLKGNIPVIRTFNINGRLFDKNTGKPLEKANIKALEAIVDKGNEEDRREFRRRREEARNTRQDLRGNSDEVKKLREEARKENDENKNRRNEARVLNQQLTSEEIVRRGKSIIIGSSQPQEFNTSPQIQYSGGRNPFFSFNGKDYTPSTPPDEIINLPPEADTYAYFGNYVAIDENKAKQALDDFISTRRDNIANTRISRFQTDENGKFSVNLKVAVLPSTVTIRIKNEEGEGRITKTVEVRPNDVILLNPKLLYTKGGYLPTTQVIKNLDNTLKTDLNVISLINIDVAAEEAVNDLNNEIDKAKQKVNQFFLSGAEKIIVARRKQIMKVVGIIKNRLVPLAIGLLITFGITKLIQKNQKVCPTPETLRDNVRRRNRIVKQLNQIFAALILNTSLAAVFTIIALKLRELRITLDSLPFPVSTPPGLGVPYSTIAQ